jgi:sigma-B regulation protein RsbU (phosphoserine phosphatase)
VREALLPLATPLVEGYDIGAAFVGSLEFGGDFHDFIERGDGRVGLLVCDVSGSGIPAALIGATARAYLRTELERTDHVLESMHRVNRRLVDDVRRGMYVTALYAEIDPSKGRVQVVCAGHKIPLLRYRAADGKLRVIHPEGIALGFDRGPVFERRLVVEDALLEPGDRLVLTNSAPVALANPSGEELGERGLYARVLKHAALDTQGFLKALRRDLDEYTGGLGIQRDVSLVTVARES